MTIEELEALARKDGPGVQKAAIEWATHIVRRMEPEGTPPNVLSRKIRQLAAEWPGDKKEAVAPLTPFTKTPLQSISETARVQAVIPTVERIRHRYWQDTRPPFRHNAYYTKGAPWLEAAFKDWAVPTEAERDRRDELHEQGAALADEAQALTGEYYSFLPELPELSYMTADRRIVQRAFGQHHQVYDFARGCLRISEATGFVEWSIPQLILCGVKPPLPRATIRRERGAPVKLAGGTFLSHDAVVVRFQVPDVSLDELGDLYRMVSSLWDKAGTRGKSRLTEADKLMHEILTDLGGLGRVRQPDKFWNRVQKEWRRHTGLTVSTNTLTVKARRMKKKLNEIDDHFNVYTGGETTS